MLCNKLKVNFGLYAHTHRMLQRIIPAGIFAKNLFNYATIDTKISQFIIYLLIYVYSHKHICDIMYS